MTGIGLALSACMGRDPVMSVRRKWMLVVVLLGVVASLVLVLWPNDPVEGLLEEVRKPATSTERWLHQLYLNRRANLLGPKDRDLTVKELVKLGPGSIPRLRQYAIEDSDSVVRTTALEALVRLRDPHGKAMLCESIRDHGQHIWMLWHIKPCPIPPDQAATMMVELLKDPSDHVRCDAAMMLSVLDKPETKQALLQGLSDPHCLVRMYCAEALGHMKDPAMLPVLRKVAETDDALTARMGAQRAISRLASECPPVTESGLPAQAPP